MPARGSSRRQDGCECDSVSFRRILLLRPRKNLLNLVHL